MEDLRYQLALALTPTVGSRRARSLLLSFDSGKSVFEASDDDLLAIEGITAKVVAEIRKSDFLAKADKELEWCTKNNVHILSLKDENYPFRLRNIPDPPVIMFYRGENVFDEGRMLGIIGTRTPTEKGKNWTCKLIDDLCEYDPIIVSGLAYGIDITAHRQALQSGLRTIAILGSGINNIYPSQYLSVARSMTEKGAIISEHYHDKGPDRENFPMRNRIIAGLSDAIIMVESAKTGGSMITTKLANEYNRDVFARPGRPQDDMSVGCNLLIKSHQAQLIDSAKDLVYVTQWKKMGEAKSQQRSLFVDLTEEEKSLVKLFQQNKEITIEKLAIDTKMPVSRLSSILLSLEFKGLLKSLPGSRYLYIN